MMEGLSSMMTSAASAASNAQSAMSAAAASATTALTPAAEGGDAGVGVVVKKMAHGLVVDAVAAHGPANGKLLKGDTMVAIDKKTVAGDEASVKKQVLTSLPPRPASFVPACVPVCLRARLPLSPVCLST